MDNSPRANSGNDFLNPTPTSSNRIINSKADIYKFYRGVSILGRVGAFEAMAIQGKINPLAGDSEELNKKCDALMDNQESEEYKRLCFKEREDWLFNLASKVSEPINYAVYGCNHKFFDNLDEWNKNNENKFSLIILRPDLVVNYKEMWG